MNGMTLAGRILLAGTISAAVLGFVPDLAQAAYSARVEAGTLKLHGDSASDKLVLRLQPGSPGTLQADVGADGSADFSFDRTTFTAIDVEAGGGDDEVRIDQSGGAFTDEAVTMNGGAGDDTLIGGAGAETFIGGTGEDFADGNIGADKASLGAGADRFQWDPGDGSDTVDGQGGSDQLDFNGSNHRRADRVLRRRPAASCSPGTSARSRWTWTGSSASTCARSAARHDDGQRPRRHGSQARRRRPGRDRRRRRRAADTVIARGTDERRRGHASRARTAGRS